MTKTASLLIAIAILALGAGAAIHMEVSTDIRHFLPEGAEPELTDISSALADSPQTKTMILSIGARELGSALAAAQSLADRLRREPDIAWVRSGSGPDMEAAIRDLYYAHRFHFLNDTASAADLTASLSESSLRQAAQRLRAQLALPTGTLVRSMAPSDPLLTFPAQLDRLRRARLGRLQLIDDQLATDDQRYAIVFAATDASPFAGATQARVQERLSQLWRIVLDSHPQGDLVLEQAGAHRLSIASERSIRADISRVSILSTIAIVAVYLLLFRSVRQVVLAFVPVLIGTAAAFVACWAVLDRIHGITLAFGAALIGVCVDYTVHLINHHWSSAEGITPLQSLRAVRGALLLGAITTAAGFGALAFTSLPSTQEIALFSVVGVLAALLGTFFLVPPWLTGRRPSNAWHRHATEALWRGWLMMRRRASVSWGLWIATVIIAAVGLSRVQWNDDLRSFNRLDPVLLAEDARVRARVSPMETSRVVVAIGPSEEAALERNDAVSSVLEAARAAGEIEGFSSVHALLWSSKVQRRNLDALRNDSGLVDRLGRAFQAEGFVPDAFSPFAAALATHPSSPLRFDDVASSPLGDLVQPFRIQVGDRIGFLTFLQGVRQPSALAARVRAIKGAVYFDQVDFLSSAYRRFRSEALVLTAVGLLAVWLIVWLRYRAFRLALAAFLPALGAAAATLGLVSLLGWPLSLFHVVSLLLVLSMGVDYGVFVVEHHTSTEALRPTLLGMTLACFTTIVSFGLLAMSSNPALQSFGFSVAVGAVLALVLAPTGVLLLGKST